MVNMWKEMKWLDDECPEGLESLTGLELSRLRYLAEHPELEDPVIAFLPESGEEGR